MTEADKINQEAVHRFIMANAGEEELQMQGIQTVTIPSIFRFFCLFAVLWRGTDKPVWKPIQTQNDLYLLCRVS